MRRRLVLFMLLGVALATAAPPAHAQAVELELATSAPAGSATRGALDEWATKVATRTGGKLTVRVRVLGDEGDAARKMRLGQIEAATLTGVALESVLPAVRVLDLPFLCEKYAQLDWVREQMDGEFRQMFAREGYVLLAWSDAGPLRLFSKANYGVEELAEKKVLAADSIMNNLTTPLAVEVLLVHPEAFQWMVKTGDIDAYYGSYAATVLAWNSKFAYASSMVVALPTAATLVTRKFFYTLTPEQQTILVEESRVLQARLIAATRTDDATALATLTKRGLVSGTTPAAVDKRFRDVASSIGSSFDNGRPLYSTDLRLKVEAFAREWSPSKTKTTTTTTTTPTTPPTTTTPTPTPPPAPYSPPPPPVTDPTKASRLPIGAEVALFHPTHKRYMRIDGNTAGFVVNGPGQGTAASALPADWKWERFRVIDAGDGRVALYNPELKRFVRMVTRGNGESTVFEVESTGDVPNPYDLPDTRRLERFEVKLQPDGRVALYHAVLQRYLSMKSDYDFEGATAPMGFDVGILTPPSLVPGSVVALFHQTEKCFVRVHGTTGRADCGGHKGTPAELPADWTWERFLVVDAGPGRVALYNAATERFLRMTPESPPGDVPANEIDSNKRATADLPADWSWERFTVEERGLGVVALSNHTPRAYLSPPGAGPDFDLRAYAVPGLYLVHVLKAAPTAAAAKN